jgi:Cdc6-like AAA superfamily ATPase
LYSRIAVNAGGWTTTTGATATISNTAAITIVTAASSATSADNFGIFDNSTSGNLLFYGALGTGKSIAIGDEVKFNASQLTIRID